MRIRVIAVTAAAGLALAACTSNATDTSDRNDNVVQVAADTPFRLRAGEIASVGTDGLMIAFRRVDGDSRCPSDVTCVWSGDATVVLDVTVGRVAWTAAQVHTHVEPRATDYREYRITLVDLSPVPVSTRSIAAGDYSATLEVARTR